MQGGHVRYVNVLINTQSLLHGSDPSLIIHLLT